MYIIIISSAIVGKVNAVSIVNKKNTQHKLNYLTVFFCLFVCATGIFFQDPRERGKKVLGAPTHRYLQKKLQSTRPFSEKSIA